MDPLKISQKECKRIHDLSTNCEVILTPRKSKSLEDPWYFSSQIVFNIIPKKSFSLGSYESVKKKVVWSVDIDDHLFLHRLKFFK
jgi:hypothetical protein